jgi:hypothetical protein
MTYRRALAIAFVAALSACKGSCSCGTTGDDDDGSGGSGAATSTSTSTTTTTTTTTGGSGGSGGDATVTGSGGGDGGATAGTGGTGGTGQGGSGGGGGSGGEEPAARECEVAEDCQLVEDCCTCDAIPAGETPEECLAQCEQSACSAFGRPKDAQIACVAGRCVAGFECNWALTVCDAAPPDCADGTTASVIDGCYGPCVPTTECMGVASCEQCDGGLGCVQQSAFQITTHCVTDGNCEASDCECLGPTVCTEGEGCFDEGGNVVCECIAC